MALQTEAVIDAVPCGIFSFLDDGTLAYVNNGFCALTGYTAEELLGKNAETCFTIATKIFFQTHFYPLLKIHGQAEEIFITLLSKAGDHIPVLLNAKRGIGGQSITSCAFIHVPNRKKFEDEIVHSRNEAQRALRENSELIKAQEQLNKQAEQLDKQVRIATNHNHELQQVNHVVTHNLKEPLRKILLYIDKLTGLPVPDEQQDTVSKLSRASQQMKKIVTDLQQYVWIKETANQYKKVQLPSIIHKVAALVDAELKFPLHISGSADYSIEADQAQLELLLYHIFSNAVNFRKGDKAELMIEATIIKRNRFISNTSKYLYEDHIKITFRDAGIGFDPAYKDVIFDLFKRMHYHSGQGLGLALCKKIVENHAGSISAESVVGEYTVITVILPVKQLTVTE